MGTAQQAFVSQGDAYGAPGTLFLFVRVLDAIFDPFMGVIADRTNTRWGKFRPWILFTAVPWAIIMVLAYTTPKGWSMGALIAYAAITNTLLMSIYSMNNMPYSALGGVMTGDLDERTRLNSYRFVAVNIAQGLLRARFPLETFEVTEGDAPLSSTASVERVMSVEICRTGAVRW